MKWIDAPIHPTEESVKEACVSITAPTRKGVWSPVRWLLTWIAWHLILDEPPSLSCP